MSTRKGIVALDGRQLNEMYFATGRVPLPVEVHEASVAHTKNPVTSPGDSMILACLQEKCL